MRARKMAIEMVVVASMAAITVAGGMPSGRRTGASPTTLPAVDAATQTKIDELFTKLDEAAAKVGPFACFALLTSDGSLPTEAFPEEAADAVKQMHETAAEITRHWLGADVIARIQEYQTRKQELSTQYQAAQNDASFDPGAKQARLAEVRKAQAELLKQNEDAVAKETAVRWEIIQREVRRPVLATLKGLLKSSDSEWTALKPKIEAVIRLREELRGVQQPDPIDSGTRKWQTPAAGTVEGDLMALLTSGQSAPDNLNARLAALRKERAAEEARLAARIADLRKRLKAAQDALRELLTVKEEATLVVEGLLD